MFETTQETIHCPYCGEKISLVIDLSTDEHDYIEDCEVCCRPIDVIVSLDQDGDPHVETLQEND